VSTFLDNLGPTPLARTLSLYAWGRYVPELTIPFGPIPAHQC